jgi:fatty acid CoA ligase FadD22
MLLKLAAQMRAYGQWTARAVGHRRGGRRAGPICLGVGDERRRRSRQRAERRGWSPAPAFHDEHRHLDPRRGARPGRPGGDGARRYGVRPGDRVCWRCRTASDGWSRSWRSPGSARPRCWSIPSLPSADHEFIADDCAAALCLTGAELRDHFAGGAGPTSTSCSPAAGATAGRRLARRRSHAPLYVQYTSGTTGEPKGVVHHHGDLPIYHDAVAARCSASPATTSPCPSRSSSSRTASATPSCSRCTPARRRCCSRSGRPRDDHGGGRRHRRDPALRGAVGVRHPGRPGRAGGRSARSARRSRPARPSRRRSGERPPSCSARRSASRSARPRPGTRSAPTRSTTTCPARSAARCPATRCSCATGRAARCPTGNPASCGSAGPPCSEYLNRPAETARRWSTAGSPPGTWPAAARRHLRHLGRVDDMEMVGGITVSPMEVERLFAEHPLVREVAVAAVPDQLGATKLRAFVVPAGPVATRPARDRAHRAGPGAARAFKVPRTVRRCRTCPAPRPASSAGTSSAPAPGDRTPPAPLSVPP